MAPGKNGSWWRRVLFGDIGGVGVKVLVRTADIGVALSCNVNSLDALLRREASRRAYSATEIAAINARIGSLSC